MDNARRQALEAYKTRKIRTGIYLLRYNQTAWVGSSPDIDKIENQLRFSLKLGSHPNRALQSAYNRDGGELEIVEIIADTDDGMARDLRLKNRLEHWIEILGARRL